MGPTKHRSSRARLPASKTKRRKYSSGSHRRKTNQYNLEGEQAVQVSGLTRPPCVGVVYVSFGEEYKALTTLSISFLRRFGYAGPVRIVTDSYDWEIDRLDCEILQVPFRGLGFATRHYKTQINKFGFDTTLLLDADTLPIASIRPIWHELRFAEICLTLDFHFQGFVSHVVEGCKSDPLEYKYMSDLGLTQHPFYSSGVMLFKRSTATDKLFEVWHEEWNRFRLRDQLALVRAIVRTKSSVHILAPRWNVRLRSFGSIDRALISGVRILHLRPGVDVASKSCSEVLSRCASHGRSSKMSFALSEEAGQVVAV